MAQNMATQQMVKNIIDGTTPPKKVKNALTVNVNGTATTYDGSAAKTVSIDISQSNVQFVAQSLNATQQAQARTNIGAAAATAVTANAAEIDKIKDGTTTVMRATQAGSATEAAHAITADSAGTATKYSDPSDPTNGSKNICEKFNEHKALIDDIVDGTTTVKKSEESISATTATSAKTASDYDTTSGTIKTKFASVDSEISNAKTVANNAQSTADTATATANNAQAQATENATNIANLQEQVDSLPTEKDVDDKVKAAIDGVIDGADEAFDTLKEVATWIATDETGTSALVNRVSTTETAIEELQTYAQSHCVMKTITLSAASWSNKLQTFTDSAVKSTSLVKAYPLGNETEVINNDVYLSTQSEGTLVFACATVPTSSIIYQLEIYNVTSLA